jgi:hypothetical protein
MLKNEETHHSSGLILRIIGTEIMKHIINHH